MGSLVFILLCAINGFALASANVKTSSWQYWVVLSCVCGSYICGLINR
jgi:hypothetical protein